MKCPCYQENLRVIQGEIYFNERGRNGLDQGKNLDNKGELIRNALNNKLLLDRGLDNQRVFLDCGPS